MIPIPVAKEGGSGAGWPIRRIGDLVRLTNGYPFDSASFGPDGDSPLVRIRDLFSEEYSTYVSAPVPPSVVIRNGDIVIGMDGDFETVLWRRGPAALNQRLCLLRPRDGVDARFIAYVLPKHLKIINDLTYATTVKHLSSFDVLAIRLPIPDHDQQRAIADYLDRETARIDAVIDYRIRQRRLIDEREFALLSSKLVPEGVRKTPLKFRARIQSGLTVDGQRDPGPDAVSRPYLRVANVQPGWLELDSVTEISIPRSLADRCTLRVGDVLMTEGGDLDKLGRGTMWRGELDGALHQNHVFAVRPEPARLDSEYLALLTRTAHARRYFERTGTRTTNLASTNSEKIMALPVPDLDIVEQQRLVREIKVRLYRLVELRMAINRQVDRINERRQALITATVTGQLETPRFAA